MKKLAEFLSCVAVALFILSFFWAIFVPWMKWMIIIALASWVLYLLVDWWKDCDGFLDYLCMVLNGAIYFVAGFSLMSVIIRAIFKVNSMAFMAQFSTIALVFVALFGFIVGLLFDRAREIWG